MHLHAVYAGAGKAIGCRSTSLHRFFLYQVELNFNSMHSFSNIIFECFSNRIQKADVEYRKGFEDELQAFKERIRRRAKEKLDAAIAEAEEEERQKRLGPGGLDPVEVFESLPEVSNIFNEWCVEI